MWTTLLFQRERSQHFIKVTTIAANSLRAATLSETQQMCICTVFTEDVSQEAFCLKLITVSTHLSDEYMTDQHAVGRYKSLVLTKTEHQSEHSFDMAAGERTVNSEADNDEITLKCTDASCFL